jgi:N-acetyl-anhydromuramyl-L-alanine amidase AmpD
MQVIETGFKFGALTTRKSTKRVIIHHTASADVPASTIHQWHLNQGWSGIGYHFVIRANGVVERGRPEQTIGAHAGSAGNGDSIGIVLTGNFEIGAPSTAQMIALTELIKELRGRYGNLAVIGHKDVVATACPGKNFPWDELRKRLEEEDEVLPQVKIKVDGKILTGFIKNDLSYAPVRALAETLGYKVDWDDKTRTVIITKGAR